jgi:hypothetical protein
MEREIPSGAIIQWGNHPVDPSSFNAIIFSAKEIKFKPIGYRRAFPHHPSIIWRLASGIASRSMVYSASVPQAIFYLPDNSTVIYNSNIYSFYKLESMPNTNSPAVIDDKPLSATAANNLSSKPVYPVVSTVRIRDKFLGTSPFANF